MAKVIHTILNLKDNMSKGLLDAAKNTQGVSKEMKDATRDVVSFGNKAGNAIKGFASTAAKAFAGTVTAATGAFFAMGSITEEYRAEQGKLNSAFESSGYSAEVAANAYQGLYKVIGDTGTATEASQLLSELTQNTQDISKWTDIVAGNYSKWGTAIDGAGLLESINESQKNSVVVGMLADSINWASKEVQTFGVALKANTEANAEWNEAVKAAETSEDFFNLALQSCANEAERNKLIMDTLTGIYGDAAQAFYENNDAIMQSRQNFLLMSDVTAKLGDASANAQNQIWALFGAQEDGSVRAGSALDFLLIKTDEFTNWVNSIDLSTLQKQFDANFAVAVEKGADALSWLKDNSDTVIFSIKVLGGAIVGVKIMQFGADTITAAKTLWQFGKTVLTIAQANMPILTAAYWKNTAAAGANKALLTGIWLKNQAISIATSSAAWVHNTAMLGVNKAGLLAHKAVGGAVWLGTQSKALILSSAAWVKNTAALAANKTALVASKVATGAMTVGTGALTAAQWALNTAFYATPIGWIVLAVMALVAAGVALYKNWDVVKAKAIELWDKGKEVFGGIKDTIVGAFDYAKDKVGGFFIWLDDKIESIPLLGDLYSGGKSAIGWIANKIGGNAMGTSYWRGGLTAVHERGGEIIDLPSGTRIIPHDISLNMAKDFNSKIANRTVSAAAFGGGEGNNTYNINFTVSVEGNIIGNKQFATERGETMAGEIIKKMENIA